MRESTGSSKPWWCNLCAEIWPPHESIAWASLKFPNWRTSVLYHRSKAMRLFSDGCLSMPWAGHTPQEPITITSSEVVNMHIPHNFYIPHIFSLHTRVLLHEWTERSNRHTRCLNVVYNVVLEASLFYQWTDGAVKHATHDFITLCQMLKKTKC